MDRHGLKDGQLGDGDKVVVEYALIWEYNEKVMSNVCPSEPVAFVVETVSHFLIMEIRFSRLNLDVRVTNQSEL